MRYQTDMLRVSRASRLAHFRRTALRLSLGKFAIMSVGGTFLAVLVVLPLASMFQYASNNGLAVFWSSISSPEALFSLKFTLIIAVITTSINVVMGTAVAFMLVRHDFPLKAVLHSLVDLPIAIPAAVTGFTLLLLYGPLGIMGRLFEGAGITIMFALPGIIHDPTVCRASRWTCLAGGGQKPRGGGEDTGSDRSTGVCQGDPTRHKKRADIGVNLHLRPLARRIRRHDHGFGQPGAANADRANVHILRIQQRRNRGRILYVRSPRHHLIGLVSGLEIHCQD